GAGVEFAHQHPRRRRCLHRNNGRNARSPIQRSCAAESAIESPRKKAAQSESDKAEKDAIGHKGPSKHIVKRTLTLRTLLWRESRPVRRLRPTARTAHFPRLRT